MNATGPIIHIVDDDRSFRTAVGRVIEAAGFRVASYELGNDFLARLPDAEAGCILLDLQMPGLAGAELQDRIAEKAPLLPIIFLTGQGTIEASVRAIKAGADDFLEKPVPFKALLEAIQRALPQYERRRTDHDLVLALKAKISHLTSRETQVFDLMVRGKRNKQIAYDLGTSERTVKAHRHSIMEKLGVNSLAEVVSVAERLARLDPAKRAT